MATPTLDTLLSSERTAQPAWVYLLFTGANGMVDSGTMVWARGLGSALVIADEHGLNPGKPVMHIVMRPDYEPPFAVRYQLLGIEALREVDPNLVPRSQR